MKLYIDPTPNESGAYSTPRTAPFTGGIPLDDEQSALFLQYNGFVLIEESEDGVEISPNTEAWEAWKEAEASKPKPEPEPTDTEVLNTLLGVSE